MTKKEQIVDTAIGLFATEGYEATSIQKLAEVAGVAQGLLYRHFKNKQDLLHHIREMCLVQVTDTLTPYHEPNLSFKEAFGLHISKSCGYMRTHPLLWKVFHATRLKDALPAEEAHAQIATYVIKPIAAKLSADGYPMPELYAWEIFTLIDGMMGLYLVYPEVYPLEQVEQYLKEKINNHDQ